MTNAELETSYFLSHLICTSTSRKRENLIAALTKEQWRKTSMQDPASVPVSEKSKSKP